MQNKMILSKNIYNEKIEIISLFLFVAMAVFYMLLAMWANSDLIDGRFSLFMDELITYDGVHRIIHTVGIENFLWSITDGGDQRYGRSLWNVMALFSFIPEYFFGESGQIFAGRMTEVVVLLSAFILLSVTFVKHWVLRFLLLTSLLAMPFTSYFTSIPKPEPLQILFISIFLFFCNKNEMNLKGKYWIFLGLAFGTKISTLPIVAVFVFIAYLKYFFNLNYKNNITDSALALGYIALGLGIAVPILLPVILSLVLPLFLALFMLNKISDKTWWEKIIVLTISFSIFYSVLRQFIFSVLGFRNRTEDWVAFTFKNTGHGSDSSNIGFDNWVGYFFNDWMNGVPIYISYVLIAVGFIVTISFFINKIKHSSIERFWHSLTPLTLILSGLILNLSIFLTVPRLWGHYLYTGAIIILVGLISIFENYIIIDNRWAWNSKSKQRLENYFSYLGVFLIFIITFYYWSPGNIAHYDALASRTKTLEYKEKSSSYNEVLGFLSKYTVEKNKPFIVTYDPTLYLPVSNEKYKIDRFWGPYGSYWKESPDVIVFSKLHTLERKILTKDSVEYDSFILERDGYNKYVINKGDSCLQEKCYQRHLTLSGGGEILVLIWPQNK